MASRGGPICARAHGWTMIPSSTYRVLGGLRGSTHDVNDGPLLSPDRAQTGRPAGPCRERRDDFISARRVARPDKLNGQDMKRDSSPRRRRQSSHTPTKPHASPIQACLRAPSRMR